MKQNIIMILILIALFIFGLLLYDFSDEVDPKLTSHDWYIIENNELNVISFKDNKFSYYEFITKKPVSQFELCTTYRFNRSIRVIKLNCNTALNKLYIASYDENELVLTINGEEKKFYATEELANIGEFKKINELTNDSYNELMNVEFSNQTNLTTDDIFTIYKNKKETKIVAFISSNISYKNIFNYKALKKVMETKDIALYNVSSISLNDAQKLNSINKDFSLKIEDYSKKTIDIYEIGNKKVKLLKTIDINSINEVESFTI